MEVPIGDGALVWRAGDTTASAIIWTTAGGMLNSLRAYGHTPATAGFTGWMNMFQKNCASVLKTNGVYPKKTRRKGTVKKFDMF